jgi:hypothetical protein
VGEKLLRLLSRDADATAGSHNVTSDGSSINSVAAFFAHASQQEHNPLGSYAMAGGE